MTQSFKKIGFAVLFTALTTIAVQAQSTDKGKKKKHQCTEQCANGKHMYKHGEKKHKCGASCKTASSTMELKDHVCTEQCANGKHMYAHGEKGHICDANCKSKM